MSKTISALTENENMDKSECEKCTDVMCFCVSTALRYCTVQCVREAVEVRSRCL